MLLVLDTNVLFMALYSSKGASFRILQLIRDGEVQLALSIPTFSEYQDVLLRQTSLDTLNLEHVDVEALLDGLAHLAFPFDIHYLMRPNLRDEADNMFVDLAFASSCDCIVTSNVRDFRNDNELKFDGFRILTPTQFIKEWEESND
jgi:putative PIN family toxin of toxin-antitoxin system